MSIHIEKIAMIFVCSISDNRNCIFIYLRNDFDTGWEIRTRMHLCACVLMMTSLGRQKKERLWLLLICDRQRRKKN